MFFSVRDSETDEEELILTILEGGWNITTCEKIKGSEYFLNALVIFFTSPASTHSVVYAAVSVYHHGLYD